MGLVAVTNAGDMSTSVNYKVQISDDNGYYHPVADFLFTKKWGNILNELINDHLHEGFVFYFERPKDNTFYLVQRGEYAGPSWSFRQSIPGWGTHLTDWRCSEIQFNDANEADRFAALLPVLQRPVNAAQTAEA